MPFLLDCAIDSRDKQPVGSDRTPCLWLYLSVRSIGPLWSLLGRPTKSQSDPKQK